MESAVGDYEKSVERYSLTRKSKAKLALQSQVESKYERIEKLSENIEREGLAGRPEIISITDRDRLERARSMFRAQTEGVFGGRKKTENQFSFSVLDVEGYSGTQLLRANLGGYSSTKDPEDKKALTTVSQELLRGIRSRFSSGTSKAFAEIERQTSEAMRLPEGSQRTEALEKITSLQETFNNRLIAGTRAISEFDKSVEGLTETASSSKRTLPAYMMQAINATLAIGAAGANLYHLQQTSFDLSSPQGMVNALYAKEIGTRQQIYRGVGQLIGGAIGTAVMPIVGTYVGAEIGGRLGDIGSTIANTQTEVEQKQFNQLYGKTASNVSIAGKYQIAARNLSRFRNAQEAPFLGLDQSVIEQAQLQYAFDKMRGGVSNTGAFSDLRTFAGTTIPFAEIASIAGTQKFTGKDIGTLGLENLRTRYKMQGREDDIVKSILSLNQNVVSRFTDKSDVSKNLQFLASVPGQIFGVNNESGKLSETGLSKLNALQGITTPTSPAHEAMLFRAIKQQNPNMSFTDIQLRMKEGFTPDNIRAMMSVMPRNVQFAEQFLMATAPQLNATDTRNIAGQMASGNFLTGKETSLYGSMNVDKMSELLMGQKATLTPTELANQKMTQSDITAGLKNVDWVLDVKVQFNDMTNSMTMDAKAFQIISDQFGKAIREMQGYVDDFKSGGNGVGLIRPTAPASVIAMSHRGGEWRDKAVAVIKRPKD